MPGMRGRGRLRRGFLGGRRLGRSGLDRGFLGGWRLSKREFTRRLPRHLSGFLQELLFQPASLALGKGRE